MRLFTVTIGMLIATQFASAQTNAPRRALTEVFRLDAANEDFSALNMLRQGNTPFYVGPRQEIVVPLPQDMNIRTYDSTGKRIGVIGRRGNGPGEFRNFFRIGWTRDTLWAYDAAQRRVSYFDAKSALLRTTVLSETLRQPPDGPDPHVISDFAPSAIAPGGNILGQILVVNGRAPEGWLLYKYFVAAVSSDFKVTQLAEIPPQAVAPRAYVTIDGPAKLAFTSIPFANDALYAFSTAGDRFAIVTTDRKAHTFTAHVYKATGETIFSRSFPFRPRALPATIVDSAVAASTKNVRQAPEVLAQLQKKVREGLPGDYPPIASIVLGRDGSTWLRVNGTADPDIELVLNAKGDAIAQIPLTRNIDIVEGDARRVWAVETDSDGLGSIVVYTMK